MTRSEFNAFAALALAANLAWPNDALAGTSAPHRTLEPAPAFKAARDGIQARIRRDGSDSTLLELAKPRFYDHGVAVQDAVVLFHGFTTIPKQFDLLARHFHARGANVYVPRIPHHGKKDRLTRDLVNLNVEGLQTTAIEAYQLSRGLGKRVTALGLSLGGSMALYLAQTQPIDHAVAISPFLMPIGMPKWFGMPAMRVLRALPARYWWWDPRVKEASLPPYAYPGYPTHALAECIFFGGAIFDIAQETRPLAKRCTLVTNQNESAVNNSVARDLLSIWNRHGAGYKEVVLSGLGDPWHDIIDPTTFPKAPTLVYPKLEAIVLGR